MDESVGATGSGDDGTVWSEGQAIELWKHFSGVGTADKIRW